MYPLKWKNWGKIEIYQLTISELEGNFVWPHTKIFADRVEHRKWRKTWRNNYKNLMNTLLTETSTNSNKQSHNVHHNEMTKSVMKRTYPKQPE